MHTIVIIGAGFSGTATAINLLRQCLPGTQIILVNRSGSMARGLAYGTSSPQHLLNVPVGNMSILADDKDDFLRFCRGIDATVEADSFVSRKLYGDYLSTRLDEAEQAAVSRVGLLRLNCEARRVGRNTDGPYVELGDGRLLHVDHVVLAFGHFSPCDPGCIDAASLAQRYQRDPWQAEPFDLQMTEEPVLLVGAGLTALDVVTGLLQRNHRGPIYMLSRRGLLPMSHRAQRSEAKVSEGFIQSMLETPPTIREYMQTLRQQIKSQQEQGVDWRDLIAALRPVTSELWRRLPIAEKRRFLRHVQPYWDAHRHRVAPESYNLFRAALVRGQVRPMAGRLLRVEPRVDGVRVIWRARGRQQTEQLAVSCIMNCTGPNGNLDFVEDALIQQLRADGLILADQLGLGIEVDQHLATRDIHGDAVSWLSYIGPMLKGRYWEATAVPELRQYAAQLAARLLGIGKDCRLVSTEAAAPKKLVSS